MADFSLSDCFRSIPDPRNAGGKRHPLVAILNLVSAAVICGMKSLEAISEFGRNLPPSQIRELGFTHARPPCKATLSNVLRRIDLHAMEQQLRLWASQRVDKPSHIALDGKTARGSVDGNVAAVHLLSAYAVEAGVVLAQVPVDDKTNEHKVALGFLKELPLQGATVTADAMFTHRDFCQTVLNGGGDYLLPVQENQPNLRRDIEAAFAPQPGLSPPTAAVD